MIGATMTVLGKEEFENKSKRAVSDDGEQRRVDDFHIQLTPSAITWQ